MIANQTSPDNFIDEIIKENKIHRFACELQYTTDTDRRNIINEIIRFSQIETQETLDPRTKLDNITSNIDSKSMKQSWGKLDVYYKINRMETYLNKTIEDKTNRKKLLKQLTEMLENGKLKTSKEIDYNKELGEIVSISFIVFDDKNKEYVIKRKV